MEQDRELSEEEFKERLKDMFRACYDITNKFTVKTEYEEIRESDELGLTIYKNDFVEIPNVRGKKITITTSRTTVVNELNYRDLAYVLIEDEIYPGFNKAVEWSLFEDEISDADYHYRLHGEKYMEAPQREYRDLLQREGIGIEFTANEEQRAIIERSHEWLEYKLHEKQSTDEEFMELFELVQEAGMHLELGAGE